MKTPLSTFLVMMSAGYVAAEMASIGPANHGFMLSILYGFAAAATLHFSGRMWGLVERKTKGL